MGVLVSDEHPVRFYWRRNSIGGACVYCDGVVGTVMGFGALGLDADERDRHDSHCGSKL